MAIRVVRTELRDGEGRIFAVVVPIEEWKPMMEELGRLRARVNTDDVRETEAVIVQVPPGS